MDFILQQMSQDPAGHRAGHPGQSIGEGGDEREGEERIGGGGEKSRGNERIGEG